MKRAAAGLIVVLLMSGCGGKFCKPGATTMDFERDKRRCMNDATAYSHNMGAAGNPFIIADQAQQCLQVEYGWSRCAN
jgi:hypothetical protein